MAQGQVATSTTNESRTLTFRILDPSTTGTGRKVAHRVTGARGTAGPVCESTSPYVAGRWVFVRYADGLQCWTEETSVTLHGEAVRSMSENHYGITYSTGAGTATTLVYMLRHRDYEYTVRTVDGDRVLACADTPEETELLAEISLSQTARGL